jgi:hypothetical protein
MHGPAALPTKIACTHALPARSIFVLRNPYRGPPMTLGAAAAAQVRLIVWCKSCQHQVEPDPAEMAARYGADTSVLELARDACLFPLRRTAGRYGRDREQATIG